MTELPPAGWYADPDGAGERYWDGGAWTARLRPLQTDDRQTGGSSTPITPARRPPRVGRPKKRMIGGLVLFAAGVPFLLIGLFVRSQTAAPAEWVRTNGLVISVAGTDGCTPVARYSVAGVDYSVTSRVSSSPCPVAVGDSISVAYDPARPADARVEDAVSRWFPWVFIGVGGILALFASVSTVRAAVSR